MIVSYQQEIQHWPEIIKNKTSVAKEKEGVDNNKGMGRWWTSVTKESEEIDDNKGKCKGWATKRVWSGDGISKYISNDEILYQQRRNTNMEWNKDQMIAAKENNVMENDKGMERDGHRQQGVGLVKRAALII